ncbi:MAG: hypothetical protein JWP86_3273 [Phenylobacterium sp.]|nr:hypothetical protein [Phenylobacterium sp.]MDB5495936.1 hypothetical protein [Phenylobacterium sp.]
MSDRQEITERRARILAELSELGLASARDLHQRQLAAETAKDAALLANSLHRISRSIRQTLALEAKLDRDARKETRREAEARVAQRKAQVKATVERLIWDEAETQEREDHLRDVLTTFLDEDDLYGHLAEGDIDTHIARLCTELGIPPPPAVILRSGGTPDPGDPSGLPEIPAQLGSPASPCGRAEDDEDDYWRSSA